MLYETLKDLSYLTLILLGTVLCNYDLHFIFVYWIYWFFGNTAH